MSLLLSPIPDFDPDDGIAEYDYYDPTTEQHAVRYVQDVEPVLEENKALQTLDRPNGQEMRWVAQIPTILIHKWLVEEGLNFFNKNHWPAIRRKLNSSEYRFLRTRLCTI